MLRVLLENTDDKEGLVALRRLTEGNHIHY